MLPFLATAEKHDGRAGQRGKGDRPRDGDAPKHANPTVRDGTLLVGQSKRLGVDALSRPDAFGRALWLSREYQKAKVRKGRVDVVEYEEGAFADDPYEFAVWAPEKYSPRNDPYPVILCIPDEGEDPKTQLTEKWLADEIRDNVILAAPSMREDGQCDSRATRCPLAPVRKSRSAPVSAPMTVRT